ncbi:fibrobacter succinogenes major paralogous domain-containing protein [Saprospiraceae bacterium]|nr:fibrobacter succinogenes major paralogous domain-containing protein [Saprospiraceae bacterium]
MKTSRFWTGFTCIVLLLIANHTFGQEVEVLGSIKVVDGTEGDGKILTSDSSGLASWQDEVKQQFCVSIEGDTLYISGGGWVIIPGISVAQWPVDGDGNVIRPTLIGNQYWMTENLKSTSYADGTPITKLTSLIDWTVTTPGYGFKNNNEPQAETFGYYYNQYVVADTNSHQICPVGWRIPTADDLQDLIDFVGVDSVGYRLKSDTTAHWSINNGGLIGPGNNEYFFNAKGAGTIHYPSQGNAIGLSFYFYTSDYNATTDRWTMGKIIINSPTLQIVEESWSNLGGSVRCMRDKP